MITSEKYIRNYNEIIFRVVMIQSVLLVHLLKAFQVEDVAEALVAEGLVVAEALAMAEGLVMAE